MASSQTATSCLCTGCHASTLALTCVEMALVRANRLTATERAMVSAVRGRPRPTHGGFS
jgi:hypothetical protein